MALSPAEELRLVQITEGIYARMDVFRRNLQRQIWERGGAMCCCGAILDRKWRGYVHTKDGRKQHRAKRRETAELVQKLRGA